MNGELNVYNDYNNQTNAITERDITEATSIQTTLTGLISPSILYELLRSPA